MFQRTVPVGLQILLVLLCHAGTAGAQSTIHFCGADLQIGMAKARVLEITSTGCELKSLRTTGTEIWCAKPTERKIAFMSEVDVCDVLQFDGGTLINANRHISEASGEASADIVNRVYEFVRDAKAAGSSVVIETAESEIEKQRHRTLSFTVGQYALVLIITQSVGASSSGSSVGLIETLARRPSPAQVK